MADFSGFKARRGAFDRASGLVARILASYSAAAGVAAELAAYQGGLDAELTAGVNSVFTAAQRQELGVIAQKLATLAADLEANHSSILSSGG